VEKSENGDALHKPKMMPKLKLVLPLRHRAGYGDRSAGLQARLVEGELSAVRKSEKGRADSGPGGRKRDRSDVDKPGRPVNSPDFQTGPMPLLLLLGPKPDLSRFWPRGLAFVTA
jgi:hypothetical protein